MEAKTDTDAESPALADRTTADCPMCPGTVFEGRDGETWHCARCARRFDPEEVPR